MKGLMLCITSAILAYFTCWGYRQWTKPPAPADVFSEIYAKKIWGTNAEGEGNSGPGSTLKATVVYRAYLQSFLKDYKISSVVDAGCGDWEFSHAIDWSGVDYKGYDIVASVVAKNQKKYSAPNVHFYVANIVDEELPAADLLICRHVLQHLPNRDIMKFLTRLSKYKHALLTNGVDAETLTADNQDIQIGEFRPLDMTQEPFTLPGQKVLTYWDGSHMHQVVHVR